MIVYTAGYIGWTLADLADEVRKRNAVLIDVRMVTMSRNLSFTGKSLRSCLGESYLAVREFGNVNYKNGGPIFLLDAAGGEAKVACFKNREAVILLCGCKDAGTCHRSTVAEWITRPDGVFAGSPIMHLEPSGRTRAAKPQPATPGGLFG